MARKPNLRIVDHNSRSTKSNLPAPPCKLGEAGRKFWDRILAEYKIDDQAGRELLALAAQSIDRAENLSAAIKRDGEMVRLRSGNLVVNSAIKVELGCRSFTMRCLQKLGILNEPLRPPGRPPGIRGGAMGAWDPPDDYSPDDDA